MDHGAGMPLDSRVFEAMKPYFMEDYGNPSSSHSFGNSARNAIESSREKVAQLVAAPEKPQEVIFTSGGTESNNLAIKGAAYRNREKGNHIITTAIEHISVINICKFLQKQGFEVTYVPVDKQGMVDLEKLEEAINDKTSSSRYVCEWRDWNNSADNGDREVSPRKQVIFHVDAVAAAGQVPINVKEENIDLYLSLPMTCMDPKV